MEEGAGKRHSAVFAVIMAGGAGTRFWPKSRLKNPKQFLKLLGKASLLSDTVRRASMLVEPENCFVVTHKQYHGQVFESIPEIPPHNVIFEPANRDTASCIGLAALKLSKIDPEGIMMILPSDHYIGHEKAFMKTLESAIAYAEKHDYLMTLGIKPDSPQTGYGYICWERILTVENGYPVYQVQKFTEKPDQGTALFFLKQGTYLWNSGIFVWKISVILNAMEKYLPELYLELEKIEPFMGTPEEGVLLEKAYPHFPKVSIDYGIMEKADNIGTIPGDFIWDDVGSWSALEKYLPKDERNNTLNGGKHIAIDSRGCIIDSEAKLIATIGVEDLIIIQSEDVMLVCRKDRDQEVKRLVEKLKRYGLEEYL
ncbi:mannose-1-phosphate guanylyltransferase [Candidatus Formimonas warabiya]|nr:mannose-1-phosphate guanylyltransferase [Candidatus Formimonas warabiya]